METISGLFHQQDAALRAGERAREVVGAHSNVSVFWPGGSAVFEDDLLNDRNSFSHVSVLSLAIGATGAVILAALRVPAMFVLLWAFWAVAAGLMFGSWFTGESHRVRIRRVQAQARAHFERRVKAGDALVVAVVQSHPEAQRVAEVLETSGGHLASDVFAESIAPQRSSRAT